MLHYLALHYFVLRYSSRREICAVVKVINNMVSSFEIYITFCSNTFHCITFDFYADFYGLLYFVAFPFVVYVSLFLCCFIHYVILYLI